MKSIAVLMTCHNRVNITLDCLARLFSQTVLDRVNIVVYLVDDGSTDGTGEAVSKNHPGVNVISADGSLFWNRGMHRAFEEALKTGYDYYFWLNDDTSLYDDALEVLLHTHEKLKEHDKKLSIVVGSTRDARTKEFTYGGYLRKRKAINPIGFRLVQPGTHMFSCDSMCGNCILIPKEVEEIIGNIDPRYRHRWGDVDYGIRARKGNCQLWVAPGYLASCAANPDADKWRKPGLPLRERLAELHSVKGLDKQDWFQFVRRHGGILWPLIWISPYIRLIITTFR